MEETNEPKTPETPVPETPVETPVPETPVPEAAPEAKPETPKAPNKNVTLEVTLNGETKRTSIRFHTPTLLAEVQGLDDAAEIEILAGPEEGKDTPQTLLKGTKKEAVEALERSVVKPEHIIAQFQNLVRFLVDHSTLKAVGVELVCLDDAGDVAGTGFVSTTEDCTKAQAIALVNCGDANMDEFATKAQLDIPGRHGAAEKGVIIAPTPDQVRKLG